MLVSFGIFKLIIAKIILHFERWINSFKQSLKNDPTEKDIIPP